VADSLQSALERARAVFGKARCLSASDRMARLEKLIDLLVDHQDEFVDAIAKDFGQRHRYQTLMGDIFNTIAHCKYAKKHVRRWMRAERRATMMPMGLLGARTEIRYQPKGVVGIMAPWNFPVAMVFNPLAYAFAAGNVALVKPSELTPETSALMHRLFSQYFPGGEVQVVEGGADVAAAFASLPFDHLFFTGSGHIGKRVMAAAAQHLTPVTLELGGKSPVYIAQDADLLDAAEKIIAGKGQNSGQVCVSPDYIFVHETQLDSLVANLRVAFQTLYPDAAPLNDLTSLIDQRSYDRVRGLLENASEAGAAVHSLSAREPDSGSRVMPIHLVINPQAGADITNQEIFGPVIMLKTYQNPAEVIDYINTHDKPLALYAFGKNLTALNAFVDQTSSGGVTINDVMVHLANVDAPFGGVGGSGMGNYHGREGFLTFSHARTVYRQGALNLSKISGMLPPFGEKMGKTLASMIKK
jgi:coniferyl-aldehyde dehydrogenase